MSWLKQLQERLDAVDLSAVNGPKEPVAESEQVLDEATDEARRLWAVRAALYREARELMAGVTSAHILADDHDEATCEAANKKLAWLKREHNLVNDLLWHSVRSQFDDTFEHIVIRAGWQVVKLAEVESNGQNINELPQGVQDVIDRLSKAFGFDPDSIEVVEETMIAPKGLSRMLGGLIGLVRR